MAANGDQKPSNGKSGTQIGGSKDRLWHVRFWDGMNFTGWIRLLVRNRFAVAPRCIVMALIITQLCFWHLFLWAIQKILFGRKIEQTEIEQHPIFIIGHWRSGTTLLHELLVLDPRYTYPDTFDCFAPNHFLVSHRVFTPILRFLLPSQRPMDNMATAWDRPQEDEFAICNMGIPSPYTAMAFPNRVQDQEYLDLQGVPPAELDRWKERFVWFLKCLTLRNPKRIVLKSPPHTCRIKVLLELFPDARFIHITRDPYVIFPSTVNLWKSLYKTQGLQVPRFEGLGEHVFATFEKMHETFQRDRGLIGPSRLCDVRYEDLVADPVGQLRAIYERLELGEFETVRPALQQYADEKADYKPNRYEISPETEAEIRRRWRGYFEQYGYALEPTEG